MKCPTCSSPAPNRHPAIQEEGEVSSLCPDNFHRHDIGCDYPRTRPCRAFSTDGTRLGAQIAHEMGTDSEEDIIAMGEAERLKREGRLTGMDEEQADWESDGC